MPNRIKQYKNIDPIGAFMTNTKAAQIVHHETVIHLELVGQVVGFPFRTFPKNGLIRLTLFFFVIPITGEFLLIRGKRSCPKLHFFVTYLGLIYVIRQKIEFRFHK